jgi:hypothetical protein
MNQAAYTMTFTTYTDGSQQIHWRNASGNLAVALIPNGEIGLYDLTFYGARCGRTNGLTIHDGIGMAGATLARWAAEDVDPASED